MSVRFANPFHPNFSPWNYGIRFRDDGDTYQLIVFDQRGNMTYFQGDGTELEPVNVIPANGMLTSGNGENELDIIVLGTQAIIFLNDELLTVIQVTEPERQGEISLVTDVFNQTVVTDAHTEFYDLSIHSASLAADTAFGELLPPTNGDSVFGDFSHPGSEAYVSVSFKSPANAFSGDYSFGLVFRATDTGIENRLLFNDQKSWLQLRRATDGTDHLVGSGDASVLRTREGDTNVIEVINAGQRHLVYLNGAQITTLEFDDGDVPFSVAPVAVCVSVDQPAGKSTTFANFRAWMFAP